MLHLCLLGQHKFNNFGAEGGVFKQRKQKQQKTFKNITYYNHNQSYYQSCIKITKIFRISNIYYRINFSLIRLCVNSIKSQRRRASYVARIVSSPFNPVFFSVSGYHRILRITVLAQEAFSTNRQTILEIPRATPNSNFCEIRPNLF